MKQKESVHKIASVQDLRDPRSKEIAEKYKMSFTEIVHNYFELADELSKGAGEIDFGPSPEVPLNAVARYLMKVACGLVVCYELMQSEIIEFPVNEKTIIDMSTKRFVQQRLRGVLERAASIKEYEEISLRYEEIILFLEEKQNEIISELLNE